MVFNARVNKGDMLFTPSWIIEILCDHINFRNKIIWEPAFGGGHIAKVLLNNKGVTVIGTDIITGNDFLTMDIKDLDMIPDCIITNPPYSMKDQFIERCIDWKLPFALLLPLPALGGKKRSTLWQQVSDLSVIIPNKRVSFINADDSPNFESVWFCGNFGLKRPFYFVDAGKYEDIKL